MATTTVVDVNPSNRQAGEHAFTAPQPVAAGLRFALLEVPMELADKLSVGTTVKIEFYFSPDGVAWEFANSTLWTSYGPEGKTVVKRDGSIEVNPNPMLFVPLATRAGQRVRAVFTLSRQLRVGLIVTVTT